MKLVLKGTQMLLYCTYEQRFIPKMLQARWHSAYKAWGFGVSLLSYKAIKEQMVDNDLKIDIDPEIVSMFKEKEEKISEFSSRYDLKTKPYKHQTQITDLILNKKKGFAFTGVGTGKSKAVIDAVSILHHKDEVKKCLVISPASIMVNFGNEIDIHSHLDYTIIDGPLKKRKELMADSNTVFDIINYEIVSKMIKEIQAKKYDMVILDEVHYCKNHKSLRSKSVNTAVKKTGIKFGLSGTIICNNIQDMFMPYKIVDDSIFGNSNSQFNQRYLRFGGYMNHNIIGYKGEHEFKTLAATNSIKFDLRDVLDLPEEVIVKKEIPLSATNQVAYNRLKKDMMIAFEDYERPVFNVLEKILRLSQMTSGVSITESDSLIDIGTEKLDVLKDLVKEIDGKIAIFCRFTRSIDRVAKMLDELGISNVIFDGRSKDKRIPIDFNNNDTKVFIGQIQKSEGYSIPNAKYCIFYELDYSRKNHTQAKGRNLRASGSETGSCVYIYLLVKNSIDDIVYNTLKQKDFDSEKALEYVRGVT